MSRKGKRREPPNDGDQNMPDPEPQVLVRCVACHLSYNTTLRAFNARGCACPKCGESKAQLLDCEAEKPAEPEGPGYEEKTEEE